MNDKSPFLKLKLYLFSSSNAYLWQDQWQRPVKDKKYGSSSELLDHPASPSIGSHPYDYVYRRENAPIKPSYARALRGPTIYSSFHVMNIVRKPPYPKQEVQYQEVHKAIEISRQRGFPREG